MRPTDLATRLNRLADLCHPSDTNRRRVLENIDLIAQGALDAEQTYVNKRGEAVTTEAPQWVIVLKAQQLAAQLLGLDATPDEKPAQPGGSAVDRINANAERRLGLVAGKGGT